jgi:hypothetical protein
MTQVTREMISAAHKEAMRNGDVILSAALLERIYRAMVEAAPATAGVRVLDEAQRLNVLASFAHSVIMGAIRPKELPAKAREALERTGLLSLDDVVALGVKTSLNDQPKEPK